MSKSLRTFTIIGDTERHSKPTDDLDSQLLFSEADVRQMKNHSVYSKKKAYKSTKLLQPPRHSKLGNLVQSVWAKTSEPPPSVKSDAGQERQKQEASLLSLKLSSFLGPEQWPRSSDPHLSLSQKVLKQPSVFLKKSLCRLQLPGLPTMLTEASHLAYTPRTERPLFATPHYSVEIRGLANLRKQA